MRGAQNTSDNVVGPQVITGGGDNLALQAPTPTLALR